MSGARSVNAGAHVHVAVCGGVECSRALSAVGIRGHNSEVGVGVRDWGVEREHEDVSRLANINNARGE